MSLIDGNNTGEMSFLEHLEELRWAILKSAIAITVGMIGCFFVSEYILNFLIYPTRAHPDRLSLQFLKPAGMFMVRIMTSLACGFALSMPYVLYQFWTFISPGLLENEKKYIPYVIFFSTLLFLLGGSFAFFVLIPVLVNFFILMGIEGVQAQWDIGEYIGLVTKMILLNGAVFEMPIIIGFLTWLRIVSPGMLKRSWRYALVIIFILAAVITPTGDPFTQIIVAIPLVILYFLSLTVSSLVARGRGDKEEAETDETIDPEEPDAPTVSRASQPDPGGGDDYDGYDLFDFDPHEYVYENPDVKKESDANRIAPQNLDHDQNTETGAAGGSSGDQDGVEGDDPANVSPDNQGNASGKEEEESPDSTEASDQIAHSEQDALDSKQDDDQATDKKNKG